MPVQTNDQNFADPLARWKIWLAWVTVTVFAAGIGGVTPDLLVLGLAPNAFKGDNAVGPLLIWGGGVVVVLGIGLGCGQAWVLAQYLGCKHGGRWVGASFAGTTVSAVVIVIMGSWGFTTASAIVPGLILGFTQWLVLRRSARSAQWWIAGTSIAWWVSVLFVTRVYPSFAPASSVIFPFYPLDSAVYWAGGWIIGSLIFAIITGLVLVYVAKPRA